MFFLLRVSHPKGRAQIEGVWEQSPHENISTKTDSCKTVKYKTSWKSDQFQ
jgi:hypothetical protein